MQYTPHQLKEKLLEGLDEDNNVVDMGRVLQVISILENYPITREALEQTRIGRSVNELRRKTSNDQLAKRAKRLVRNWQKVVNDPETKAVNGDRVNNVGTAGAPRARTPVSPAVHTPTIRKAVSPAISKSEVTTAVRPHTPNSVKSSLSPQKPGSKPSTPGLPQLPQSKNSSHVQKSAKRFASSPQLSLVSAKRPCISPGIASQPGTPDSYSSHTSKKSAKEERLNNVKSDVGSLQGFEALSSESSNKSRKNVSQDRTLKSSSTVVAPPDPISTESSSKISSQSDQNGIVISVKGNRNGDTSQQSLGYKSDTRYKTVINGTESDSKSDRVVKHTSPPTRTEISPPSVISSQSSNSISARKNINLGIKTDADPSRDRLVSLTPKVKNTAQLIQSLKEKSDSFSVSNHVARQIQTNQIEREMDIPQSVVPEGARPRHRKKAGDIVPPSTSSSLSKTKTEMVEKFLETAVTPSSAEDLSPLKYDMSRTESPGTASTSFDDSIPEKDNSLAQRNLTSVPNMNRRDDQTNAKSVIHLKTTAARSEEIADIPEPSLSLEEIYSRYPPLDLESFQFDSGMYDMPDEQEVNEGVVERLHTEHWTGVNGCLDSEGTWRDWTQTLSLQSASSEFVHVLPYVIVDD